MTPDLLHRHLAEALRLLSLMPMPSGPLDQITSALRHARTFVGQVEPRLSRLERRVARLERRTLSLLGPRRSRRKREVVQ